MIYEIAKASLGVKNSLFAKIHDPIPSRGNARKTRNCVNLKVKISRICSRFSWVYNTCLFFIPPKLKTSFLPTPILHFFPWVLPPCKFCLLSCTQSEKRFYSLFWRRQKWNAFFFFLRSKWGVKQVGLWRRHTFAQRIFAGYVNKTNYFYNDFSQWNRYTLFVSFTTLINLQVHRHRTLVSLLRQKMCNWDSGLN